MALGSLCSGYGGLDEAACEAFGAQVVWQAEIDPDASKVLAVRYPGVPNLGDLTAVDWSAVEPVDVLCAGFPCQPVSSAGRGSGLNDERWLFDDIADAVGRMDPRPRWLCFENVPGLLSANRGAAMGRVIHRLARLGYVGRYRTVRASDVGAPHRRARVFIVASDASGGELQRRGEHRVVDGSHRVAEDEARQRQWSGHASVDSGSPATDASDLGHEWGGETRRRGIGPADGGDVAADADEQGPQGQEPAQRRDVPTGCDWGPYAAAIARWERVTGTPAPAPVDDKGRLNPALVEWMMGLHEGWVTDVLPKRTAALRVLGNGVVPQQAAYALRLLIGADEAAA